jgi:hypothetical protein
MVTSTFLNKIFEFSFYKKEISNDVKYLINEIKDIALNAYELEYF